MKKGVRIASIIMVLVFACATLFACNERLAPSMETDLSVDYESDIGLYFFNADGEHKRYSSEISNEYFDKSKPTVVFFHGWMTESYQENEICKNADNFASKIIDAGYNFCSMDYCHHAGNLVELFRYIWSDFKGGHSVACRFAKEYATCFENYSNEIRFVSHSYGAHSSVATAYLLSNMIKQGIVKDGCMPTRMTFADPYLGDIISQIPNYSMPTTIENINEPIGDRSTTEVFADCMQYLANEGIVMDVYAGMPFAYDQYLENDAARRKVCRDKVYDAASWTILTGLQEGYGTVGDIHMITLDWVFDSFFASEKKSGDIYYPTASLSNDKILALKGKCYNSTLTTLDCENDVLFEVDRNASVDDEE